MEVGSTFSFNGTVVYLIFGFSNIWVFDLHVQSQSALAQTPTPPWILWRWTVVKWMAAEDWMIQRNRPPQRKGCSKWILLFWTERRMKSPSRLLGMNIMICSHFDKVKISAPRTVYFVTLAIIITSSFFMYFLGILPLLAILAKSNKKLAVWGQKLSKVIWNLHRQIQ